MGHRRNASQPLVDHPALVAQMLALLDELAVKLGGLIDAGRSGSLDVWHDWITSSTPFTVEEARRLRAVHLAYAMFPQEAVDNLPSPWQALWTIPAGRIGRGMPQSAHHSKRVNGAEMLAARLLQERDELPTDVRESIERWLHVDSD